MSTDTYLDFHSEESFDKWGDWLYLGWDEFMNSLTREEQERHYHPERIGHVSYLTCPDNYELWDDFVEVFSSSIVTEEIIAHMLELWNALYDIAKYAGPDAKRGIHPDSFKMDLLTTSEMEKVLRENMGKYIYVRVD